MKIRLMIILGIAAILFTNCTKSEIDFPSNTATVVASMESDAVKSSATDEGYFTWTDGDKIAIHTSEGDLLEGTLNDGEGSASGSFSYSYTGDAPSLSGYALYPYNDGHSININESAVTFVMPATYELDEELANTNSPMLSTPVNRSSETVNYDFAHLGGLFRFVIKNAPIGANKFTLRLGGKKINGSFVVSLSGGTPQINTAEANEENDVTTLSFNALESAQDITLFVPVPVGEYTGIRAILYAGAEELGSWGSNNAVNNVSRKSLMLMAPITFSNAGGNIENEISVGSAIQLEDALQNDGIVILSEPIALSKNIEVPDGVNTTIDLQGQALNNGEFSIVVGEGSTLNIINNAAQTKSASSATIEGSGDIIVASKNSKITVSAGVSLTSTDNCCIFVPEGAEGATITTAGNLLSEGKYATVQVNGLVESGFINITGGSIKHTTEIPLYIAGNVNVTISGNPTIESEKTTALEQRAGTLTINSGTFIANGNFTDVPNGNGSTTTGVAVAICQHNTQKETRAIINGGTFTGAKSVYMKPYGENTNVSVEVRGGSFSDLLACEFAVSGAEIKLTRDIEMSKILVINKDMTLDGGNHSITSNVQSNQSDHRAINVTGVNEVTIKNLTIETNGERAINIIGGTKKVILDNVTATADNYTVNVAGSAPNAVVTITRSMLTGKNVVNVGAVEANVTVSNSTLNCEDDDTSASGNFAALCLNKDATGGTITATGTTITVTDDSVPARNDAEDGNITINGSAEGVEISVAVIEHGNYYADYTTLQAAIDAATSGQTIKLIRDITASDVILIDKNITIDGNNKKITSSANRVLRLNTKGINVTMTDLNIVSTDVRVGEDDIRGISFDGVGGMNLTLNNCTVDFTHSTANAYAWGVNMTGSNEGTNTLTVEGGTYEGANAININGNGHTISIDGATLTSLYEYKTGDNYTGACVAIAGENNKLTVKNSTFNGDHAVGIKERKVGEIDYEGRNTITKENNTDNTKRTVSNQ